MKISNEVLEVLSRAEVSGKELKLTMQLDRKMYEAVNKVLEACGGKWNRKAKAHIFDIDAAERIDQIIVSSEVEIPKDEYNYFPTPPEVVARLLELAALRPGMTVLEPSAGRGHIVKACIDAGAKVYGYELMKDNCDWLNFSGFFTEDVEMVDFLTVEPKRVYDRVIMNPPFMNQADIRHVNHALKFLKPGGLLVSVMGAGVEFRSNKLTEEFRAMVKERKGSIEALPEAAFKSSGTMVRTVIVTIPNAATFEW